MIGYADAITIFSKLYPKKIITKCIDYDALHFVIEAIDDFNTVNVSDPYYGIDKRSKRITSFTPSLDLDYFFDAIENRTLYDIDHNKRQ